MDELRRRREEARARRVNTNAQIHTPTQVHHSHTFIHIHTQKRAGECLQDATSSVHGYFEIWGVLQVLFARGRGRRGRKEEERISIWI